MGVFIHLFFSLVEVLFASSGLRVRVDVNVLMRVTSDLPDRCSEMGGVYVNTVSGSCFNPLRCECLSAWEMNCSIRQMMVAQRCVFFKQI